MDNLLLHDFELQSTMVLVRIKEPVVIVPVDQGGDI